MQPAGLFTIHDTQVDTRPFGLAIQGTTQAVTSGHQQVAEKIQGLVRTLGNRNAQLQAAQGLIDRVHVVLAQAVPDDEESADDALAQTVVAQRDEALEREQALLGTLHAAIPDSEEEVNPAALVGQLIQAKTEAEAATEAATQAAELAQQQAALLNQEIGRLRQQLAGLAQQVQRGTDDLLRIGANLQIDPAE